MVNILNVKNLRKEYKEFTLGNISFQLPKGCIMGIIGPNGAGKTTTIKILMNMIKSNGGDVDIFGLNYDKNEKDIKNRIGYVGEEQYFYQNKTTAWTGRFVAQFFKEWDKAKFDHLLEKFDLSRTKKIKELSKGMKVKLSFAIALSHNAELLILDEPTSGLDPVIRREILELLQTVCQEEDKSVILSSHITDDIARIADFITFMVDGKIVMSDEKDKILANWKKIHFKKGALDESLKGSLKNVQEQMFGSAGITDRYLEIKEQLSAGMETEDIKIENVNLDDILISFVNGKAK
ncbi:MAG: ABC transporter ATP-binding protein [bacterium]|nr:ABC transporter ATP-binding protein [bacterium]